MALPLADLMRLLIHRARNALPPFGFFIRHEPPARVSPAGHFERHETVILHVAAMHGTAKLFLQGHFRHQRSQGWRVIVACSKPIEDGPIGTLDAEFCPIRIQRSIAPLADLTALAELIGLIRRTRPSIVHAHTPKAGLLAILACHLSRARRRPVAILHLHGLRSETMDGPAGRLVSTMEHLSASLADHVLCVSPSLRETGIDLGVVSPGNSSVLGDGTIAGVDATERFNPARFGPRLRGSGRQSLGLAADDFVVGYLGRLANDKQPGVLYEAFLSFVERTGASARLLLVGRWDETDEVCPHLKRRLLSDPRVLIVGWTGDPARYLAEMDVLVSASKREGFGVSILEAGALMVPCVALRATGIVDAIADGHTGVILDRDAAPEGDLARALTDYYNDPALRLKHGTEARVRVLEQFCPERAERLLADFYVSQCPMISRNRDFNK